MTLYHGSNVEVSTPRIADDLLERGDYKIKIYEKATDEWLDFVIANRRDLSFSHDFDIVKGPVANDKVYACLNAYENGFMDRGKLLSELKIYVLVDQVLFHTDRAIDELKFARSIKL